jgi:rhamnulokinase
MPNPALEPARVAIDLGAESCRVSLLRWSGSGSSVQPGSEPTVELVHRIPNGPVRRGDHLHWPLGSILAGLEEGLRKCAAKAPEGIASIGVDSWSVDYVRIAPDGTALRDPFCYRDERTVVAKERVDAILPEFELYQRTGALPLRINTVYQLVADGDAGIGAHVPWAMFPEFFLYWLSGRSVAEYSNASHSGLVNLKTGNWDPDVFRALGLAIEAAPPIVSAGTILGPLKGSLTALDAFRHTKIIAPASHDTASAIAGIPADMSSAAYLCAGTWSLVGTLATEPVATREALDARYTNLGSASGRRLFHTLVNGMWLIKQCMDGWAAQGRRWTIEDLVQKAAACDAPGIINVDAEPLMLELEMPQRINNELTRAGFAPLPDTPGNEPLFARVIFESLAARYGSAVSSLEHMLGRKLTRIHMLGGANRNRLLVELTEKQTGLPVEIGETESSTIGSLAVQLAASDVNGASVTAEAVRTWAARLCQPTGQPV